MNSADEVVLESINNRIRSLVECAEELVRRKQRVHIDLAKLTPVVRGKLEKAIGESRVLGPKAIEGRQKGKCRSQNGGGFRSESEKKKIRKA